MQPTPELEATFLDGGGKLVKWRPGRALEDELFLSLPDAAVRGLVERAVELHGEALIDARVRSASKAAFGLDDCRARLDDPTRQALARASRTKQAGWFKSVSWMEDAAADIVGPNMPDAEPGFRALVGELFAWMA